MINKKVELKVVKLHDGDSTPQVKSLYDRIIYVIEDYCADENIVVTGGEVVGILEYVKKKMMES